MSLTKARHRASLLTILVVVAVGFWATLVEAKSAGHETLDPLDGLEQVPEVMGHESGSQVASSTLAGVVRLSFSESILQTYIHRYLADCEAIERLDVCFDAKRQQIRARGTCWIRQLARELGKEDGDFAAFDFDLAIALKVLPHEGHLVLEFDEEHSTFLPAGSRGRAGVKQVPACLGLALAIVRPHLAALSGDTSLFEHMKAQVAEEIEQFRQRLEALDETADPFTRELLELKIQRRTLKIQSIDLRIKRAQHRAASGKAGALTFLTGRDIIHETDTGLVFRVTLSQLAPFLQGVGLGRIHFYESTSAKQGTEQRYLCLELDGMGVRTSGR